jgi:hypothetical protein
MPRLGVLGVTQAVLLALVLATPAAAKEVTSAKACGVSDCRQLSDRQLNALLPTGNTPTGPPSHPTGGWYRITISLRAPAPRERFTIAALPRARVVRDYNAGTRSYNWAPMTQATADAYRRVLHGLEPLPMSRLRDFDQRTQAQRSPSGRPELPSTASTSPADAFPWGVVTAALGAAALAGAVVLSAWRRRRPGPQAG